MLIVWGCIDVHAECTGLGLGFLDGIGRRVSPEWGFASRVQGLGGESKKGRVTTQLGGFQKLSRPSFMAGFFSTVLCQG